MGPARHRRRGAPRPLPTPIAVVDLDAFDANADDLARRAGGKPVRVASKSLRVPALVARALAHDGFSGVLAYTVAEALHLHPPGSATTSWWPTRPPTGPRWSGSATTRTPRG